MAVLSQGLPVGLLLEVVEPVVDMAVLSQGLPVGLLLEVVAPEGMLLLAVLDLGRIALLVVSDAVEVARALCRMWAAGRASTRRRRHTSMSDMAAILVVPGGILPALLRAVAF